VLFTQVFLYFLPKCGVPFRILASVFLQQLRIALTAKCGHFIECFRRFDTDTVTLKAARSSEEVTADKQVITYKRIGKLKTALVGVYNTKRKYGEIPEPQSGKYPVKDGEGIFAMRASVHHSSTPPAAATPAPAPAPASI
jgi:hypothetical protein